MVGKPRACRRGSRAAPGTGLARPADRLAVPELLPAADAADEKTRTPETTATPTTRTAPLRRVKRPCKKFRIIGTFSPRKYFGESAMTL